MNTIISSCVSAAVPIPPVVGPSGGAATAASPASQVSPLAGSVATAPPLQRLGEVRRRERVTRCHVAKCLGISIRAVEKQEQPSCDMLLSDLHRWQKALRVPVAELLDGSDDALAPPVQLRARLLRAMKTVRSIQEMARQTAVRRLAETLAEQLLEVMPELKDTTAWPAVGRRRRVDELGQAFFRRLSHPSLDDLDRTEE